MGFYSRLGRPGPHRHHWIRRIELRWVLRGSLEGGRLPEGNRRGSFLEFFAIVGSVCVLVFYRGGCVFLFFVFFGSLEEEGEEGKYR